jgi:hypothetical protein
MFRFIIFTILFNLILSADTFTLKNGKILYGKQIEKNDKFLVYRDSDFFVKTIKVEDLDTVEINAIDKEPNSTAQKDPQPSPVKNTETEPVTKTAPSEVQPSSTAPKPIGNADSKSIKDLPASENDASIELTTEVVSDFVWRGNSYGGEYLARRNNLKHKSTSEYWAFQPNLRVNSPVKGLYLELWGNFPLVGRNDRDSDMRLFQAYPNGPNIDPNNFEAKRGLIESDPAKYNLNNTGFFYDPSSNVVNNKCKADATGCSNPGDSFVDPRDIGKRKEKNGMARTDGVFTTFAYNFQNKKFGDITWGIWYYYQLDKNAKYSWDEYFIIWGLPFLQKSIKPTFSLYTQASFDFASVYAGGHYLSYSMSHTFNEEKFFRIQPAVNLGYKYANNNIDQKSGFYDFTTNLKFFFGDFFVSVNNAYRPNLYMYDNDQFFFPISQNSQTQPNRSAYDGKTVDPSKLYGPVNQAVYDTIDKADLSAEGKSFLKGQYQNQKIVQNLFWISFGYNLRF